MGDPVAWERQFVKIKQRDGQSNEEKLAALKELVRNKESKKDIPLKKLTEPIVLAVPIPPILDAEKRAEVRRLETFAPQTYDALDYKSFNKVEKGKAKSFLTKFKKLYAPFAPKYVQLINRIRQEDARDRNVRDGGIGFLRKHLIYVDNAEDITYLAAALESAGFTHMRTHIPGTGKSTGESVKGFIKAGYGTMPNDDTSLERETFVVLSSKEGWGQGGSIYHMRSADMAYSLSPNRTGYSKEFNTKMFEAFNDRSGGQTDNSVGQHCRFLIIDRASAEGVNIYDIGHLWITAPPEDYGLLLQIIGRATRSCGNEGIEREASKVLRGRHGRGYNKEAWTVNVHLMMSGFKRDGNLPPILVHHLVADTNKLEQEKKAREVSELVKQHAVDAELYGRINAAKKKLGLPSGRNEELASILHRFYDPDYVREIQEELSAGGNRQ